MAALELNDEDRTEVAPEAEIRPQKLPPVLPRKDPCR